MTRVELTYDLTRPLAELDYERLSKLTSAYGVMGYRFTPDASAMVLEYDATRLGPDGVDRVLRGSGLPVKRSHS
jgi:hypothetical protein